MSDFDQFFAEKLSEEGYFPRKEKNWRALSKRLDAFDTGLRQQVGHVRRFLRYWQAAAACAIVTAGWLTWKLDAVQKDNAGLRRGVAVLQEKNNTAAQELALLQQRRPNETAASSATIRVDVANATAPAASQPVAPSNTLENAGDPDLVRMDTPTNPPDHLLPGTYSTVEKIASLLSDSLHRIQSLPPFQNTIVAAAQPKIIEPVRNPSRFRAGIQVSAGLPLPHEKGISILLGQGIAAEYNIWRDFWLTASADWMRYDVSTEKYVPKFHSPHHHPPSHGGSPQEKLVKVQSTERQQQFGVGLRYALPMRSWARPAVRAAYTLTRTSPELVTFKFEHQGPGGPPGPPAPKYKVQRTESQILENVWRFGAGLEHETPSWVFGVWADYSKNFAASDETFDALMFRAGLQYRFN